MTCPRSTGCTRRRRGSLAVRSTACGRSSRARPTTRSRRPADSTTRCAARASGFCVYNDVALAVAAARDAGHRVLYVDLDVHHGDGTQALFWDDPDVLTFSIHESGRTLFPGSGWPDETGGPGAPGTAVNVPLDAYSGDASWWPVGRGVAARAGRGLRADVPREPARLRLARPRPAGPPAPHDRLVPARDATPRRARSRALRRSLVRDRGRWLRRLPGRAAVVGARVARAGPSRHAR